MDPRSMHYGTHQEAAETYSPPADESDLNASQVPTEEFSEENTPTDAAPKKTRKGVPLSKRISQLTYQNKLLQDQLQRQHHVQSAYQSELQQRLEDAEKKLAQKEDDSLKSLQTSIQSNEEVILDQIRRAREINDMDEAAKWEREHASLMDSKARLYAEKAVRERLKQEENFETYSQPLPRQDPYIPPAPVQAANPYLEEWLEETPWANEHDPNFSRELLNEAIEVEAQMSKILRLRGQGELIGTRDYFKTLNNIMYERYNGASSEGANDMNYDRPVTPPADNRQGNPYVSGVARQGGQVGDRYNNPQARTAQMRLTPEQEMFARNLQIKGPDGNFLPPHLARERFIKHLSNPAAADMTKPGGTPDRLTINYGA